MPNLYELADDFLALQHQLESSEEFDAETIANTMEAYSGDLETKCTNVAKYIENEQSMVGAIDEAIKKMQARKKALQNKTNGLKHYLKSNMERTGITEITCPYFAIKIKKCPPSVEIKDPELVPVDFKSEEIVVKIDKTAIKNEIKANGSVPGAQIVQNTRLEIK